MVSKQEGTVNLAAEGMWPIH